jgi:CheY-like chemotaxis protein
MAKVGILEDNKTFQCLYASILGGKYSHTCEIFNGVDPGKDWLGFYNSVREDPLRYDALIIDLQLPMWDGEDSIKAIKSIPNHPGMIVVSSEPVERLERIAREHKTAYVHKSDLTITKVFQEDSGFGKIDQLVRMYEALRTTKSS